MIDKLGFCTKALSLRKELGEDTTSPVDIFRWHTQYHN